MARRPVQYGVVNMPAADVPTGAPGFRATWQSNADLRDQLMAIDGMPNNGKVFFWDGQVWLDWDAPDDLPGPDADPLRIKVVGRQGPGQYFLWAYNNQRPAIVVSEALCHRDLPHSLQHEYLT